MAAVGDIEELVVEPVRSEHLLEQYSAVAARSTSWRWCSGLSPRFRCASLPARRGFGIHTPSRTFVSASSSRSRGTVSLPIDGDSAAPDIATAAGRVRSRRRFSRGCRPRTRMSRSPPTSGPPIAVALKVKLGHAAAGRRRARGRRRWRPRRRSASASRPSRAVSESWTSRSNFRATAFLVVESAPVLVATAYSLQREGRAQPPAIEGVQRPRVQVAEPVTGRTKRIAIAPPATSTILSVPDAGRDARASPRPRR